MSKATKVLGVVILLLSALSGVVLGLFQVEPAGAQGACHYPPTILSVSVSVTSTTIFVENHDFDVERDVIASIDKVPGQEVTFANDGKIFIAVPPALRGQIVTLEVSGFQCESNTLVSFGISDIKIPVLPGATQPVTVTQVIPASPLAISTQPEHFGDPATAVGRIPANFGGEVPAQGPEELAVAVSPARPSRVPLALTGSNTVPMVTGALVLLVAGCFFVGLARWPRSEG